MYTVRPSGCSPAGCLVASTDAPFLYSGLLPNKPRQSDLNSGTDNAVLCVTIAFNTILGVGALPLPRVTHDHSEVKVFGAPLLVSLV